MAHVLHLHAYLLLPLCGGVALVLLALHGGQHRQAALWHAFAVAPAFGAVQALFNATGAQHTAVSMPAGQSSLLAATAGGLVDFLLLCAPLTAAAAAACTQLCSTVTRKQHSSRRLPSPRDPKQVVRR